LVFEATFIWHLAEGTAITYHPRECALLVLVPRRYEMVSLKIGLAQRIWLVYGEIVHNALFLELVSQELPQGWILALLRLMEKHDRLLIIGLAIAFALLKYLRDVQRKHPEQPGAPYSPEEQRQDLLPGALGGRRLPRSMPGEDEGQWVEEPTLEDLARDGARRMLQAAMEAEVDDCIKNFG
jgi:hypothetical protein